MAFNKDHGYTDHFVKKFQTDEDFAEANVDGCLDDDVKMEVKGELVQGIGTFRWYPLHRGTYWGRPLVYLMYHWAIHSTTRSMSASDASSGSKVKDGCTSFWEKRSSKAPLGLPWPRGKKSLRQMNMNSAPYSKSFCTCEETQYMSIFKVSFSINRRRFLHQWTNACLPLATRHWLPHPRSPPVGCWRADCRLLLPRLDQPEKMS